MGEWQGRRVLVTGAAGFIGSHVAERLLGLGATVVGLDNFDPFYSRSMKEANLRAVSHSKQSTGSFTLLEGDLTDAAGVGRAVEGCHSVIHLAAKAGVRPSIADPSGYAVTNVVGTSVVLESARAAGVQRVVVASSSSVYGNASKVPFAEDDPASEPISPYAATKRACELLGHTYHHLSGVPVAMLRFFTVYGPRQRPDLGIRLFLERCSRGETIRMFGNGSSSRDYTFVDDIVDGVLSAHEAIPAHGYRVWNLGGSNPVRLDALIECVGHTVGRPAVVEQVGLQQGDVDRTWADLSRSEAEIGYRPAVGLEEGVARQWAWMQEQAGC
jgi:UDP-glucuronate 4-epimerase